MAEFYTNQDDTLSHPRIVLELLKKITVELGTREFKGGYKKPVVNGGWVTYLDYVPDSRTEYIQGIEALSDILLPQYDNIMEKNYSEYIFKVNKLNDNLSENVRMGDEEHSKFNKKKLILAKKLFRDLNLLLKRTNYLKAAIYEEGDEEE